MQVTRKPDAVCSCTGEPPWPAMQRLSPGNPNRYYVCPECGMIREEVCRDDGSIVKLHFYFRKQWDELPNAVAEHAQRIMDRPVYRQLKLFKD